MRKLVREILVETEFLFGLSAKDRLYPKVMRILEKHRKGEVKIVVSSASPIEAALALLSHSIDAETIVKILKLMEAKLAKHRVNTYAPITLETMWKAIELKKKYHDKLTLFDSIHISLAATLNIPLLTSDKTMQNIMKTENIRYLKYSTIA